MKKPLSELQMEVRWANRRFEDAIAERIKPGMTVHVEHGDRETAVRVVRVSNNRVWVANDDRGTEYTVTASRLAEFWRL